MLLPLPGPSCSGVSSLVSRIHPTQTVLVTSDVHLGAISFEQEEAFTTWLGQAAGVASRIVLNGDLFDFWFEYQWGNTRGHEVTLLQLREIVDAGVPITLMGGNHDWWGGKYLREEIGLDFHQDPFITELAGLKTLLAHGDGLGTGDLRYRVARLLLRGSVTRWAFGMLPPALGDRIAKGVSHTEDRKQAPGGTELEHAAALEAWAVKELKSQPNLNLLLLGHTHVPKIIDVGDQQWYINTGDWVYHRSFALLREGETPKLIEWTGSIP